MKYSTMIKITAIIRLITYEEAKSYLELWDYVYGDRK